MFKKISFGLIAICGAIFYGFWFGLQVVLNAFGIVAMPDDANTFVQFLNWLFQTPWWVPAALCLVWMAFLAWKLWPNELSEEDMDRLYGEPHRRFQREIERQRAETQEHLKLIHTGAWLLQAQAIFQNRWAEIQLANYDLSSDIGFNNWTHDVNRLLDQTSLAGLYGADILPSVQKRRAQEEGAKAEIQYLEDSQQRLRDGHLPGKDQARQWAKLMSKIEERKVSIKGMLSDIRARKFTA